MPKLNIYDIVRYYLFYKTVKLFDISYDENKFALEQNNREGIEFGDVTIKLPIIQHKQLPLETAKEIVNTSQLYNLLQSIKMKDNFN